MKFLPRKGLNELTEQRNQCQSLGPSPARLTPKIRYGNRFQTSANLRKPIVDEAGFSQVKIVIVVFNLVVRSSAEGLLHGDGDGLEFTESTNQVLEDNLEGHDLGRCGIAGPRLEVARQGAEVVEGSYLIRHLV
uniref:Uncharacterized protein n=1 Tax=Cannabis sativa TaxID=3483 RepID=A0A803QTW0_CANSA